MDGLQHSNPSHTFAMLYPCGADRYSNAKTHRIWEIESLNSVLSLRTGILHLFFLSSDVLFDNVLIFMLLNSFCFCAPAS